MKLITIERQRAFHIAKLCAEVSYKIFFHSNAQQRTGCKSYLVLFRLDILMLQIRWSAHVRLVEKIGLVAFSEGKGGKDLARQRSICSRSTRAYFCCCSF